MFVQRTVLGSASNRKEKTDYGRPAAVSNPFLPHDSWHTIGTVRSVEDDLELIAAPVFRLYAERHGYTHISAGEPALRMALVERAGAATLRRKDLGWDRPGVYVLMGPGEPGFDAAVYVGKAGDQGISSRIGQQAGGKDWWTRALVIASAHEDGWSSADVGFLEGELHTIVSGKAGLAVTNLQIPKDGTLTFAREWELRRFGPAVAAVLRVLGVGSVSLDLEVLDEDDDIPAKDFDNATLTPAQAKQMTWVEAATKILEAQRPDPSSPMHVSAILQSIIERGYRDVSTVRTPIETLRRDLIVKARSSESRFEITAPSTFRLRPQ